MFGNRVRIPVIALTLLLALGTVGFTALAEGETLTPPATTPAPAPAPAPAPDPAPSPAPTPDPVAALTLYLQSLGADQATIDSATATLTNALAGGLDPAQIQELMDAMTRAGAEQAVVLTVLDRVTLMASDGLPFGQVMKVFRLSLKEGKNAGIDNALARAEEYVRKTQERNDPTAEEPGGGKGPGREKQAEKGGGKNKSGK